MLFTSVDIGLAWVVGATRRLGSVMSVDEKSIQEYEAEIARLSSRVKSDSEPYSSGQLLENR